MTYIAEFAVLKNGHPIGNITTKVDGDPETIEERLREAADETVAKWQPHDPDHTYEIFVEDLYEAQ